MTASSSSLVFLITGASRGLGKAIATVAGNAYGQANNETTRSRFLLVARSPDGIQETKEQLLSSVPSENVICRSMDLSDLDRLDSNADLLINDMNKLRSEEVSENQQHQQRLILVNNAGSLGHLGPSWKSPSLKDMRQTVDFNVTSSLWLSVRFTRYFHELQQQQQEQDHQSTQATIVNISSLVAVSQDFPGMGIYSAGKAAREMYHSLMASDDETPASLKILNYAPGPLDTSMTEDIKQSSGLHETELQASFRTTQMLDPKDSAKKLIRLLENNEFESGSHIDYFDLPDCERFDMI